MNFNPNYTLVNPIIADIIVYGFHSFDEVNICTEVSGKTESGQ